MVADDEMSMVQLCRTIKDQRTLVVALADDDAALPGEAMRLSGMQNERKRRMREAASGSGQPAGRALPTELAACGRRQLKVASAAVHCVEQDMLANLDASEQDQMRRLLTACIASLTQPPASAT
jgi:hypothetical protein